MLSLGTDVFLAFWIASYSVGFPPGSPPPARAATSMFLISLANILPRRASTTAFWCLVVAHLEWPDIGTPPCMIDCWTPRIVAPIAEVRARHPTRDGRGPSRRTAGTP